MAVTSAPAADERPGQAGEAGQASSSAAVAAGKGLGWREGGGDLAGREAKAAAGFLAFNSVGFIIFTLIPVGFSVYLAFFNWSLQGGSHKFIGFQNYTTAVESYGFWRIVLNVLYFVGAYVPLNLVISLGLAMALNPRNHIVKGKPVLRVLFFLPVVTPIVASSLVWALLYGQGGVINKVLGDVGIGPVGWLTSSNLAMPSIIIMSLWLGFGYNMILFIAGMSNIPESLYDAAAVDGAGPWRRFRTVTLPMLSPVVFFGTMMTIITSFQVFDQAYILTSGGPGNASTTLVLQVYDEAFQYFRLGYGSSIAVLLALMILVVTAFLFVIQRRWVYYEH
jgi:multiple sugar transport system permease protein